MRVVQASARLAPAPAAGPLTAAITGLGIVAMARMICLPTFSRGSTSVTSSRSRAFPSTSISPPAQNPRPAPVRTTVRTVVSSASLFRASSKACPRALFNALRRSGRFNVSVDTASRRDSSTSGAEVDSEAIVELPSGKTNTLYVQEGSVRQAAEHLGELAEVAQSDPAIHGILSRGGQDEDSGAIEFFGLQAKLAGSLCEFFVGVLAVEGDHARGVFLQLLCQQNAALGNF